MLARLAERAGDSAADAERKKGEISESPFSHERARLRSFDVNNVPRQISRRDCDVNFRTDVDDAGRRAGRNGENILCSSSKNSVALGSSAPHGKSTTVGTAAATRREVNEHMMDVIFIMHVVISKHTCGTSSSNCSICITCINDFKSCTQNTKAVYTFTRVV